jgi:hypothetical protein
MAILDSIIVSVCMSVSGQGNEACQKALTAGAKQSGVEQSANSYEQNRLNYMQSGAESFFGKNTVAAIGGVGWAAKSAVDHKASIGLPNFGICSGIKIEINSNTERLVLQWRF